VLRISKICAESGKNSSGSTVEHCVRGPTGQVKLLGRKRHEPGRAELVLWQVPDNCLHWLISSHPRCRDYPAPGVSAYLTRQYAPRRARGSRCQRMPAACGARAGRVLDACGVAANPPESSGPPGAFGSARRIPSMAHQARGPRRTAYRRRLPVVTGGPAASAVPPSRVSLTLRKLSDGVPAGHSVIGPSSRPRDKLVEKNFENLGRIQEGPSS
jgi:hypothetical protein